MILEKILKIQHIGESHISDYHYYPINFEDDFNRMVTHSNTGSQFELSEKELRKAKLKPRYLYNGEKGLYLKLERIDMTVKEMEDALKKDKNLFYLKAIQLHHIRSIGGGNWEKEVYRCADLRNPSIDPQRWFTVELSQKEFRILDNLKRGYPHFKLVEYEIRDISKNTQNFI